MNTVLPVTVIGGYLGAGKTTLVNQLLRDADGRRLAILVNEFGALPIDESLIETKGDNLISIAGGCICCAFGDNLAGALRGLMSLDPTPDHVVIESSGVAIPSSIAGTISLIRGLLLRSIIVLADAKTIQTLADDKYVGDTIRRQLADADMILLTMSDLITEDEMKEIVGWLNQVTGLANTIPSEHGRVPPEVILDLPPATRSRYTGQTHTPAFESFVLKPDGAVDAQAIASNLATGEYGVVRAKGVVQDTSGARVLIQVVGRRFEATPTALPETGGLVCIGLKGRLEKGRLTEQIAFAAGNIANIRNDGPCAN